MIFHWHNQFLISPGGGDMPVIINPGEFIQERIAPQTTSGNPRIFRKSTFRE
jgi:hypothetical protein